MHSSFRKLSLSEKHEYLIQRCSITKEEAQLLSGSTLAQGIADNLIENAIGYFPIPMGVATNFKIDGIERLIPMAVEETSIIAAASATAKWVRDFGTLTTRTIGELIIGQIQLPKVRNPSRVRERLKSEIPGLINLANRMIPGLIQRGGGVRQITIRELERPFLDNRCMMVLHVLCDTRDAMGANIINQVCEGLKPEIARITGESVGLCILSNLVDSKLSVAEIRLPDTDAEIAEGIHEASLFAEADPYRASTHNKGVLNGIDPILIATGNDWRAVEAGVHAYASKSGRYQPVSIWRREGNDLVGRIQIPMAVGTAGGVVRIHPLAKISLKILGIEKSGELARICAAVGLVQNLGALKALSTVGIVRGHMELHASNLAMAAGSTEAEIPIVRALLTEKLKGNQALGLTLAHQILDEIRQAAAVEEPGEAS